MDISKEDIIVELKIRRSELKNLINERLNLFDTSFPLRNNLRDINENIEECRREISRLKYSLTCMRNNYTAPKILRQELN